jgi:hypothetical protein
LLRVLNVAFRFTEGKIDSGGGMPLLQLVCNWRDGVVTGKSERLRFGKLLFTAVFT